jgi:tetratricopeptide (TPR) repeat protein
MVRSSVLMAALSLTYGCSDAREHRADALPQASEDSVAHGMVKVGPQHDAERTRHLKGSVPTFVIGENSAAHAGFKLDPLPEVEPDLFDREAIIDVKDSETDFLAAAQDLVDEELIEDAIVAYRKALGQDRENAEIWFKLGRAYNLVGQDARGMECLEEAIDYRSDHADAYTTMVRTMLKRGEDTSALSYAKTLRRIEPDSFRSAFLLGRSFARLKMWKESVAAFEESLEEDPEHLWANNNLGYSALQIGEYEMAIYALEVATGKEGAQAFMFNGLGYAYEKHGEPIHAIVAYDAAIEMKPRFVKVLVNRERIAAALTPEQKDEYAAFQLELPPEDTEVAQAKPAETTTAMNTGGGETVKTSVNGFVEAPMPEFKAP